ncbi:hypothetical protein [Hymenobacter sp. BT491]|uniref:hypothetical protein n=1 Tax=Hymenobacter sp. BT491 TaxID=2766779 RepID=UPI001653BC34|nr:hypothetical protein [Hymenobacter sp. BT491]MBC6988997.1 hypothetical protein [Hymenobacter sp. BT491]
MEHNPAAAKHNSFYKGFHILIFEEYGSEDDQYRSHAYVYDGQEREMLYEDDDVQMPLADIVAGIHGRIDAFLALPLEQQQHPYVM